MQHLVALDGFMVLRGCDHTSTDCSCLCECSHILSTDHVRRVGGNECWIPGCTTGICSEPPIMPAECGASGPRDAVCQRDVGHYPETDHAQQTSGTLKLMRVWR